MTKYWKEYSKEYVISPVSTEVHRPIDSDVWLTATEYDPPLPKAEVGKGFTLYFVEIKGWVLQFSSLNEIEHCITVLSNRNLPTTYELSQKSWCKGYQHSHWLTKFPGALKSVRNRMQIVKLLNKVKML
ncbi:MAG: hypothetical protein ACRBEE_13790 [Arenicella sp.]